MTPFEKFYALATGPGPIVERAREMIGKERLALLLAKSALSETTEQLSPTKVGNVLDVDRKWAENKIKNLGFKEIVKY